MPDLTINATRASVDTEDGIRHVGFAEGDEDEPYVLFTQPTDGGPVRLELNDPLFAAEDAVAGLQHDDDSLTLDIAPARAPDLGFARRVLIRRVAAMSDWDAARAALARILPPA